jgi:rare lipoprotein A
MRLYTAALLAACFFSISHQANAACGFASSYTPASRPQAHAPKPGEIFAAHPSLPVGTRVVVRNQRKGRSIVVRIAGRSAFFSEGIIDLSPGALNALGMDASAPVCVEVVSYGSQKPGYEKPSLFRGLIEALAPNRHHYAASGVSARSAKPSRSAKAHHRRRHYATARHGNGKRYAKLNRRSRSLRRSRHSVRLSRR